MYKGMNRRNLQIQHKLKVVLLYISIKHHVIPVHPCFISNLYLHKQKFTENSSFWNFFYRMSLIMLVVRQHCRCSKHTQTEQRRANIPFHKKVLMK